MSVIHVAAGLYFAVCVSLTVEVRAASAVTQENPSIAALGSSHLRQMASDRPSAKEQPYADLVNRVATAGERVSS